MAVAVAVNNYKLRDGQRRKMFGIAKSMGWNTDALRDVVWAMTGQRHISSLTVAGGDVILEELERLAKEARSFRPQPSPKQVAKIYKLGYELRWKSTTIRRFNQRTTGKWDIHDNTPGEASSLIMAMEGVLRSEGERGRRGERESGGHGRHT